MTTISRLQQILAQIRSGLSGKAGSSRRAARSSTTLPPSAQRSSPEEIRAQISSGLAAAELGTVAGRRAARRVFLESVLLAEFGMGVAGDSRFDEIVQGVQDSFEQEESLLASLDAVIADLRQT